MSEIAFEVNRNGAFFRKVTYETLMMLAGYGDKKRTQTEVCNLFNNLYPEFYITQSTAVSKIWHKFQGTGSVKDLPKTAKAAALNNEESKNVMLAIAENPHVSVNYAKL